MNRLWLSLALMILLVSGLDCAGDEPPVDAPVVSTSTCQEFPAVTCTSSDALACADTLQLAIETREQLAPLLKLGKIWRFPVHIHVMTPEDPLFLKINREAAAVFASGSGMKIEAVLPSSDPDARAFIQRQFVTALLWEKFFATTQTFDTHTQLDVVPPWLVEGLREWLNEDPEHNREAIVRRAVETKRAPTLAEVTGWQKISGDRLMGLWQRSFCFYLVDSLIRPGEKRDDFQQWLATYAGPNPTSAQLLFPTEAGWERELVEASKRSREIVYSWDVTAAELATAEVITVPSDKPGESRTCTLETVASLPLHPKLVEALQKKILDLTALELRAHPSWRPILATYRFGLTALLNDKNQEQAQKLLAQAHDLRAAAMDNHQKLVDYINWFEVTKDFTGENSRFQSYFTIAHEMERVEADPAHPNPIRANLLQIESQL